jgi:hypothetical protein
MKQNFRLAEYLINFSNMVYDPIHTKIAMEFDSFDTVYLLRKVYREDFVWWEKDYLDSLLVSFQKSGVNWMAKISLLKSLLGYISYRQAEGFLLW